MQIGPLEQATSVLSIIPVVLIVIAGVFVSISGVVIVLVILVVSNRAEPDNLGRRPLAVYFFGVSFIATFLTLFGTFAIVLGLVQLIGSHPVSVYPAFPSIQSGPIHPIGDAVRARRRSEWDCHHRGRRTAFYPSAPRPCAARMGRRQLWAGEPRRPELYRCRQLRGADHRFVVNSLFRI